VVGDVGTDLEAALDEHVEEGEEEIQRGDLGEGYARVLEG
jgi:hypothetical protein